MQEYRYIPRQALQLKIPLTGKYAFILMNIAITFILVMRIKDGISLKAILAGALIYGVLWLSKRTQKAIEATRINIDKTGLKTSPSNAFNSRNLDFEWPKVKKITHIARHPSWGYNIFEVTLIDGKVIKIRADHPDNPHPWFVPESPTYTDFNTAFRALWGKTIPSENDDSIVPGHEDVGKYPLLIVTAGIGLLITSIFLISQQKALHPENQFWLKLIPISFIASIAISSPIWLKSKSLSSFSICTIFLASCLNFLMTQYIELDSESLETTKFSPFIYHEDYHGFQRWISKDDTLDIEFGINEIWKGFVPAHIGETRYFPIVIGKWGNIVIKPEPSRSGTFDDQPQTSR